MKQRTVCQACDGAGTVCCATWASVKTQAGHDLQMGEIGVPLWPLTTWLEMAYCPFCGAAFKPRTG